MAQIMEAALVTIMSGLEMCGFYEKIYVAESSGFEVSSTDTTASVAKLGHALAELYAAIVIFCMRAKEHLTNFNIGMKHSLCSDLG